ncbi:glutaredoxin, putative [Eimeria tenella]|uniref:Glutaredoxin, putative n=1 Tax=Eimeria tenella TaxID=5802 RepID=U6KIF7_EIMTE|nr:glutaredoxin, putative [Eimeria tenella]CDJ37810.1 glutaredoxin, putative [Eimeria tenella]|eukprot:XP_013228648.1 glutaredoxin, putative [Eimeria tenella]
MVALIPVPPPGAFINLLYPAAFAGRIWARARLRYNSCRTLFASTMALNSAQDVPQWVDSLVNGHKVTIFAKTHCPYCQAAIAALRSLNVSDMHVEQIENNPHCNAIQDYLKEKTGARSVPRVFINGTFFGGGDDTVAGVKNGTLQKLIAA